MNNYLGTTVHEVLYPDPLTAAADGLHHRYAERGTAVKIVASGRLHRWNFNTTILYLIKLQPCGDLHF